MADDLLTVAESAALLRVSASSIRRWVRNGDLSALYTPGGQLRFRRSELDRVLSGAA